MLTDQELEARVQQALRQDSRIRAQPIAASVAHGVVTLTGTANTFDQYEAAEQTALQTEGVLDVANEIEVTPLHSASDAHIAEEVRASLKAGMHAASDRVKCSVSHGVVRLVGDATSWREVADAEQAAAEVRGVQDVVDDIHVGAPG